MFLFCNFQEDFDSLRPLCYPSTDVFIVCFSLVLPMSFANVTRKWLCEIRDYAPNVPVILVGTHSDLRPYVHGQEIVTARKAEDLVAKQAGIVCHIETSALTQKNMKAVIYGRRKPVKTKTGTYAAERFGYLLRQEPALYLQKPP